MDKRPLLSAGHYSTTGDEKEAADATPAAKEQATVTTRISKYASKKIKGLTLFGIICVVYTHSYNGYPRIVYADSTYNPADVSTAFQYMCVGGLLRFAVPMFFMFSGFLFFIHKPVDMHRFQFGRRIKGRVKSVLAPYLAWNVIAFGLVFLVLQVGVVAERWPWLKGDILHPGALFPAYKVLYPIPYPLWYLRDLFVLVLMTPLFYWLDRKNMLQIYIGLVSIPWFLNKWPLVMIADLCGGWLPKLYILDFDGLLFFPIGAWLSLHRVDIDRRLSPRTILLTLVLPFVCANVAKVVLATYDYAPFLRVALFKTGTPFGILSVWFMYDFVLVGEQFQQGLFRDAVNFLSQFPMWIYCTHEPLMGALLENVQPMLGLCRIDNLGVLSGAPMDVQRCTHTAWNGLFLLFYCIFPIIYIGWLVAIGYALTKVSPTLFSFLTGGRGPKKKKKAGSTPPSENESVEITGQLQKPATTGV
jgi:surface polysaccharide O-acyltransferase-like enzyme